MSILEELTTQTQKNLTGLPGAFNDLPAADIGAKPPGITACVRDQNGEYRIKPTQGSGSKPRPGEDLVFLTDAELEALKGLEPSEGNTTTAPEPPTDIAVADRNINAGPLALTWLRAMRDIPLTVYERALGSILCTYGRGENITVSMETMVRLTGMARNTIRDALKGMRRKGVLVQLREGRGRGNTGLYRLAIPRTVKGSSGEPLTAVKGSAGDEQKGHLLTAKGSAGDVKGSSGGTQDQLLDRKRDIVNHQITDDDADHSSGPRSRADDDEGTSLQMLQSAIRESGWSGDFDFRRVSKAARDRMVRLIQEQDVQDDSGDEDLTWFYEAFAEDFISGLLDDGHTVGKIQHMSRVISKQLQEADYDQLVRWLDRGQEIRVELQVKEKLEAEQEAAREQQEREQTDRLEAERQAKAEEKRQEDARIEAIRDEYQPLIGPFKAHPVVMADPKELEPEPEPVRAPRHDGLVQYEPPRPRRRRPRPTRPRPTPIGRVLKMEFDVTLSHESGRFIRDNEESVREAIQLMRDVLGRTSLDTSAPE
jgi:hypothetical protein